MRKVVSTAVLVFILFIPLFTNFYYLWLFTLASIFALYTLSWYLMERLCGRTSFGHTVPFGLTAYSTAIAIFLGYSIQIAPLIVLFIAILSTLLFYITSALDRTKFVFATFLYSVILWELASFIIFKGKTLYGGEEGFSIATLPTQTVYALSSCLLFLTFLFLIVLHNSSLGLKMMAVRDDEEAALAIGIDVKRVKLLNSFFSSTLASLAGLVYILHFSHVDPEIFSVENAVFPFIASIFANGYLSPIIGSYILIFISKALSTVFPQLHLVLYAILLIFSPKIRRLTNARN